MKKVVLMTTLGCHLCEVAEGLIVESLPGLGVGVEAQEIAEDDQLVDKYGVRIPVLVCEISGQELAWPFDAAGLVGFVKQLPEA